MSSPDDSVDVSYQGKPLKKKRGRACDACRQKKVRCDGAVGQRCANCVTGGYECTYVGAAKKRYPDVAYMEQLETELANMKKLLNKLHPGVDFSSELQSDSLWRVEPAVTESAVPWSQTPAASTSAPSFPLSPIPPLSANAPLHDIEAEDSDDEIRLPNHLAFKKRSYLWRNRPGSRPRFLGKSSRYLFLQKVLDYRSTYAGQDLEHWKLHPRSEYWDGKHWLTPLLEKIETPYSAECFPPEDLMTELIDLYFSRYNMGIPILHRPTFELHLKNGLHLEDQSFGGVVLLVCAVGARFSLDKRVLDEQELAPEHEEQKVWQSAGWKWFYQVQTSHKAMGLYPPRLFDLQIFCLASIYLYGSFTSQSAWPLVGVGLRLAQDLGAHRRKTYQRTPNVDDEQLKRAFWTLILIDRSLSSSLGRPCGLQDEEFDLDLPIECDDEYWTNPDPALAFKQPPGKPSHVTFFVCLIRLKQIHAYALRTLYATNRAKIARGYVGSEWEQNIVSELDSALNSFVDTIPDHLRWDPHRENTVHLMQSAMLYSGYYMLQINVHRPFIPSPRKPSRLSFPSLAICTNAARSCIHVLDVHQQTTKGKPVYQSQAALFGAGIVLLLNIWGGKLSGSSTNPTKEMAEVHKAMDMLKALEPHFYSAGRYWDVLYNLASVGDLPLPEPSPNHKRPREDCTSTSSPSTQDAEAPVEDSANPRPMAGSRRVHAYQQQHPATMLSPDAGVPNGDFVLPVHSAELGRLPLHSVFAPELNTNGWYAPQASAHGPSSLPLVPPLPNGAMASILNPPYSSQGPVSLADSGFSSLGAGLNQPHEPSMFTQVPSPSALPADSLENMMASVSMDPTLVPDLPENDTLAMWCNAPTSFEWDDWGSFLSAFSMGEFPSPDN